MNLINNLQFGVVDRLRGSSLRARSARGAFILTIGIGFERAMRLVRNMILARLLAPESFGLMGIIMAVIMVMDSFSDIGVRQSIIHNKAGKDPQYLNAAWWVGALRGVFLFAIGFFAASLICRFYVKPQLLWLLRFTFVAVLFNGMLSPRIFVLQKEFRFVQSTLLIQGSDLLGTLVSIALALYMRNVWVLAIGFVVQSALRCLLSFLFYPIKPNLHINREHFKEVAKFGKGMFGLPFLTVICMQADVFVLGKMVPLETLGMYVLASSLARQPTIVFARTIGSVLLPAFSEKQANTQAIRDAFLKIVKVMLIVGLPGATLAFLFSAPILSVIYGAQYSTMSTTFGVLCYAMLLHMFATILSSIYIGVGKPHLHRRYMLLLTILILITLYPGIRLSGTLGAAFALLFSYLVATFVQFKWLKNVIDFGLKDIRWPLSRRIEPNTELTNGYPR